VVVLCASPLSTPLALFLFLQLGSLGVFLVGGSALECVEAGRRTSAFMQTSVLSDANKQQVMTFVDQGTQQVHTFYTLITLLDLQWVVVGPSSVSGTMFTGYSCTHRYGTFHLPPPLTHVPYLSVVL
jgi:hypothetical protein